MNDYETESLNISVNHNVSSIMKLLGIYDFDESMQLGVDLVLSGVILMLNNGAEEDSLPDVIPPVITVAKSFLKRLDSEQV